MAASSQIYLVTDAIPVLRQSSDVARICRSLDAWAVLIASGDFSQVSKPELSKAIRDLQSDNIAVLLQNDFHIACDCQADGVHLQWSKTIAEDFKTARSTLGPDLMIGADAGKSRHDAMQLGEAGADYVAFGVPDFVRDRAGARKRQCQLIAWWAEIFEVPCVACDIDTPDEAAALADAGADFVAITLPPLSATPEPLQVWLEAHKALSTTTAT